LLAQGSNQSRFHAIEPTTSDPTETRNRRNPLPEIPAASQQKQMI
jgi:hypothetical protein